VIMASHYQTPVPGRQPNRCELSHDLNNALHVIVARGEALTDLLGGNAEALQHITAILRTAQSMAEDIRTRRFRSSL
jgi:hypothetical protein